MRCPPKSGRNDANRRRDVAGDSREDIVGGHGEVRLPDSCSVRGISGGRRRAHVRGRAAELAAEGVGEVAVAGEAQFEGQCGEIVRAVRRASSRGAEAQPGQVAMDGTPVRC